MNRHHPPSFTTRFLIALLLMLALPWAAMAQIAPARFRAALTGAVAADGLGRLLITQGDSLDLAVALFESDGTTLVDVDGLVDLTLELYASADSTTQISEPITLTSEDLDATLTNNEWAAGTGQHALFELGPEQTNITMLARQQTLWGVIYGTLPDGQRRTFGAGTITLRRGNAGGAGPSATPDPLYPTLAQITAMVSRIPTVDVWVSREITLDSNIETGGGTDVTSALNALLATAFTDSRPHRFIFDGVALISDTLVAGGTSILEFLPGSGIYKADNSPGHILTNRLSGGVTMVDQSITIRGGIFNGNEQHQTNRYEDNGTGSGTGGNSLFWKTGLWFAGVDYVEIRDVEVRNAKTFALLLGGTKKARVYNYTAAWSVNGAWGTNNWDAFHLWGNNDDVELHNGASVNGDDDALAFNSDENCLVNDPRRTSDPGVTNTGHMGRLLVDGFRFDNTLRGLRIYNTREGEGLASIGDLILRNISGDVVGTGLDQSGPATASIYDGDIPIERLEITNWQVKGQNNVVIGINARNVDQACLNNIHPFTRSDVEATTTIGNYYKAAFPAGATIGPQGVAAASSAPVQMILGSDFWNGNAGDLSAMKILLMPNLGYGVSLTPSGIGWRTHQGTRHEWYIGTTPVLYQSITEMQCGTKVLVPADVEVTDVSSGFVLKSPNGSRWRIRVSNAGTLSASAL